MSTATQTPTQIRQSLPELRTPRLPEQIASAPAPLAKIAKEYGDLYTRATEAIAKVVALEARRPEAEQADREAHASALRAGKPDPGSKASEALEVQIESSRRAVTGLIDATNTAWGEVKTAITDHAEAWSERLRADQAKQVTAGTKGGDTLAKASREVAEVRALLAWISEAAGAITGGPMRRGPIARRFPRLGGPKERIIIGQIPYPVGQVIAAVQGWLDGQHAA